jgi:sRNA-binding protein
MTITDPTALHSPKRSIVSKATQWTINTLAPLREHLFPWPAVLPSAVGDPIRPLKIGVRADLAVLLPDGEAHEVLSQVLRRYTRGREYGAALAAPDALRHDLAGNPVEPVAEEHKTHIWPKAKAAQPSALQHQETVIVSVKIKALKVTAVVPPADLKPLPPGAEVVLALEVGDGMKAMARLNPKSYRKALATIAELGAENVAVIVQGQMTRPGLIEGAGIVAQPKKPKGEP